ncbi:MAG TPA: glycosyltransferase, partial [Steroidobacteraceae bacterium]|nr:glycosyltransferase [Steroidobacteraceae bacterium]
SRFPHAQLVCAGTGDMAGITALTRELKVETRVTFPGWLAPADLAREFANATVFALPSYAEGVPMSLLEAMSWSLPVVSTPVGGIPEVLQSDRNGLLVPPGDVEALAAALARLLASPSECRRLGAAARATVGETFSITTALNELAAIYRELGMADPRPARTRQ